MNKEKKKKLVFVIGCPRSGTTWVQIMLCQHPRVATSQETHLFSNYVRHMYQQWQAEKSATGELRSVNLRNLLDEKEFLDGLKAFTDTVLKKIEISNPDCEIILEKAPQHVFDVELIRTTFSRFFSNPPCEPVRSGKFAGARMGIAAGRKLANAFHAIVMKTEVPTKGIPGSKCAKKESARAPGRSSCDSREDTCVLHGPECARTARNGR